MTMTQTNNDKVDDCMPRSGGHGHVRGHHRHHHDSTKNRNKRMPPQPQQEPSRHHSQQEEHRQQKRKAVCFVSTDSVREIPHLKEMSDDEVRSVYMSSEELKAVQQECRSLLKILKEKEESDGESTSSSNLSSMYDSDNFLNKEDDDDDDDAMCFRGLEEHLPKRTAMARKIRNGIYNSVYTMQCFHANSCPSPTSSSSSSNASESSPSDYSGMLATICRRLSAISAQHAYIAGKSDELAAIKIAKEARRMLRKKERADRQRDHNTRRSRHNRDRHECEPKRGISRSQSVPVASTSSSRHGRHSRRSRREYRRHPDDDCDNATGDDGEVLRRPRSSINRHHRHENHSDDHQDRHGHSTTTTKKKSHKKNKSHSHSRLVMVPKQHQTSPEMVNMPIATTAEAAPDPFCQRQPPPPPDPGKEEPHIPPWNTMIDGNDRW